MPPFRLVGRHDKTGKTVLSNVEIKKLNISIKILVMSVSNYTAYRESKDEMPLNWGTGTFNQNE